MADDVEQDKIQSLVDDVLLDVAESPWTGAEPDEPAVEPTPADPSSRLSFVEFPLDVFHRRKLLWAANYFVLWPLGVALTVDVATVAADPEHWCKRKTIHVAHVRKAGSCAGTVRGDGDVTNLHLREWRYPEGELGETINQDVEENQADYLVFLAYVRDRLLGMKPSERRILLDHYGRNAIAGAEPILAVEP